MPDPSSSISIQKPRKRRFHTKSRQGCGNCKLRRVKVSISNPLSILSWTNPLHPPLPTNDRIQCDETRPQCQKCRLFGVWCNYVAPNRSTSLALEIEPLVPVSSDGVRDLQLDRHDVRRLAGFQQRQTVLTIVNVFQEDVLRLALVVCTTSIDPSPPCLYGMLVIQYPQIAMSGCIVWALVLLTL